MYNETLEFELRNKISFLSKKLNTECSLGLIPHSGTYVIDLNITPNAINSLNIGRHLDYVISDVKPIIFKNFNFITFTTSYLDFEDLGAIDITTNKYSGDYKSVNPENLLGEIFTTSLRRYFPKEKDEFSRILIPYIIKNINLHPSEINFYLNNDVYINLDHVMEKPFLVIFNKFLKTYGIRIDLQTFEIKDDENNIIFPLKAMQDNINNMMISRMTLKILNYMKKSEF